MAGEIAWIHKLKSSEVCGVSTPGIVFPEEYSNRRNSDNRVARDRVLSKEATLKS